MRRFCRLPKEYRLTRLLRLSARVRVKRSGSSVLAVPSHVSRGACCHCQYPQSRNDQRVPTRAGSAILTESILFDEPTGRDISKASKVYRRRDSVRDGDAMIESSRARTRRAWLSVEIVFYEIKIIAGNDGTFNRCGPLSRNRSIYSPIRQRQRQADMENDARDLSYSFYMCIFDQRLNLVKITMFF